MRKCGINLRVVSQNNQPVDIKNANQVIVNNYTSAEIILTIKDVEILIPAATKIMTTDVPSLPYKIDAMGEPFDIELLITFPTGGTGNVIIAYSQVYDNCK